MLNMEMLCLQFLICIRCLAIIRNINFKEYLVAVTLGTCISYLLCIKTCCLVLFTSALQTIQYVKTISKLLFPETLCITKCFVVNINVFAFSVYIHSLDDLGCCQKCTTMLLMSLLFNHLIDTRNILESNYSNPLHKFSYAFLLFEY